ncbi:MAG: tetratricopeptide repeat protein, partial [Rickettsiaceae bacterium]|nr:tetratricopeptide repeat protein [Rickettsiaceae bacterium]
MTKEKTTLDEEGSRANKEKMEKKSKPKAVDDQRLERIYSELFGSLEEEHGDKISKKAGILSSLFSRKINAGISSSLSTKSLPKKSKPKAVDDQRLEKIYSELFGSLEKEHDDKISKKAGILSSLSSHKLHAGISSSLSTKSLPKSSEVLKYIRRTHLFDQYIDLSISDADFFMSNYNQDNKPNALSRLEEAIIDFLDSEIRLKPDNPEAWYNKGNGLYLLSKHDEAINAYDEATRLKPDFVEAYTNKGNALRTISKYTEAIESYNQAIRFDDKYILAYLNKARVIRDMQRALLTENIEVTQAQETEILDCLNNVHRISQDVHLFNSIKLSMGNILFAHTMLFERDKLLSKLRDQDAEVNELKKRGIDTIETDKEFSGKDQEEVADYAEEATTEADESVFLIRERSSSRASSTVLPLQEDSSFLFSLQEEFGKYFAQFTGNVLKDIENIRISVKKHELSQYQIPTILEDATDLELKIDEQAEMSAEAAMKVSDEMSTVVPVDYIPNLDHNTPYVKPVKKEQQNMKDVREKLLKKAQETLEEIYNTIGWGKTYESKKPAAITEERILQQIEEEASTFGEEYRELYKDIISKIRDLQQKELPDTITTTLETKDRTSNPSTTTNTTTNTKIKKNKTFEAEFKEILGKLSALHKSYRDDLNIEDETTRGAYENKNKLLARISNEIGNIYCKVNRLENGSIAYVNATELDTSYKNAYVNAITTYFIQGFSLRLLAISKELVKINPPLNRSFAYLLSSITLKEIGHETKAKNVLKKFLESIEIEEGIEEGIEEETTKTTEEVEKLTKETSEKLSLDLSVDQSINTLVDQSISTSVIYSSINPPTTQSVNQSSEEEAHIETSLEDSIFTELITLVRDGILSNIVQDLQLDEVKRLRGVRTEHFKEDKINRSEVHKYYQKIL